MFISFDNLLDDAHGDGLAFITKGESAHAWKVVSQFHCDLARQLESHDTLVALFEETRTGELLELFGLSVELGQESLDGDFFDGCVKMQNGREAFSEIMSQLMKG